MYSNDPDTIKDALCFFMDEERGHKVSYVQFPQNYNNLKKNNIYASPRKVINEVDFHNLAPETMLCVFWNFE